MFIVIEGVDSSGKATHTELITEKLIKSGANVKKITFPDYDSSSSALVKMYLNGEFGSNAGNVSPYAASAFYAVDRYASYQKNWKEFLEKGGVVIADRYTTSNMIHQAAKIDDINEKDKFLDWINDFEYVKMGLPVPDKVIFLDMPPEFGIKLMSERKNKFTGEDKKDIHESDRKYLEKSYNNALYVAEKMGFIRVECVKDGVLRTIDDIQAEIATILGDVYAV